MMSNPMIKQPACHPSILYQRLQAETAQMLGFNEPTELQNLQVDLIALLRLAIDQQQSAVLAGRQDVDLQQVGALILMLQRLLPEAALRVAPIVDELSTAEDAAAQAELQKILTGYSEARRRAMADNPQAAREAFEEELRAAIEQYPQETNPLVASERRKIFPCRESFGI
jgi:hypothetical protein